MNVVVPVVRITHAALHLLLSKQPWPFWAIDTATLEPLVAYQPVPLTKLLRVLRSHYIYSDVYLFNPNSTEIEIAAIDWRAIPLVNAQTATLFIISHAVGQTFLGIAPSFDAAERGDIMLLLPANDETRLRLGD